jgi:hypothetical protein
VRRHREILHLWAKWVQELGGEERQRAFEEEAMRVLTEMGGFAGRGDPGTGGAWGVNPHTQD